MVHAGGRGWVGWCTEDCACRVEDLEMFSMGGVGVRECCGWLVSSRVHVRAGLLKEVVSD